MMKQLYSKMEEGSCQIVVDLAYKSTTNAFSSSFLPSFGTTKNFIVKKEHVVMRNAIITTVAEPE